MSTQSTPEGPGTVDLSFEGEVPSLEGATAWLNSPQLSRAELRGKVVLFDFWTYTCINWLRTLPYIRAWAEKYDEHGLIVIGVHTPEFQFEQDVENVRRLVQDLRVDYPVATDNDYAVWSAFANRYWPALYLADTEGALRYHHFGEGRYAESERAIQALLGLDEELVAVEALGLEAPADWDDLETPETYVGYGRAERFASAGGDAGARRVFAVPETLRPNHWALAGEWTIGRDNVVLHEANGRIVFRFHARDVHLVVRPGMRGASVPFRVLVDGAPPGADHGLDVDEEGHGTLVQPRLYQLVRQQGSIGDRTFEIAFLEPDVEAYAFTFG